MKTKVLTIFLALMPLGLFAQTLSTVASHSSNNTNSFAKPGKQILKKGAFLRQVSKRDSILIADQVDYGFTLNDVSKDVVLALPDFKGTALDSVLTIINSWKIDTLKTNSNGTKNIEAYIRIAAFNEGTYKLPSLSALMATKNAVDTLVFDPLDMKVCTIPIDTATFKVHDIKGQIKYPITFKEILPYVGGGILLILLILAIYFIVTKYIIKKQQEIKVKEPAHIVALKELDKYRGNKYWDADKQKIFYSGVTDALRTYIAERYSFSAMEMTTAEIMQTLKKTDLQTALYIELKDLFETADFVKFAKMTVSQDQLAKVLPEAVRFVTETFQEQIAIETSNDKK